MFLKADNLKSKHGFFTRDGGVSEGLYSSLNCGLGSDDNQESIIRNRLFVEAKLEANDLVTPYQTHSDVTGIIAKLTEIEADALVTKEPGLAIGVVTADCVPILLEDRDNGVIGAAHAGWKGARFGIISSVIRAMHNLGADKITAAIGPCISAQSYEVSEEFLRIFASESPENTVYFSQSVNEGHFMFDLPQYVEAKLRKNGVKNVLQMNEDTLTQPEKFYSYRRATKSNEPDYGRQISAICL